MGRIIKMDFYRIFCSIRFWAAAAAVAILWNVAGQRFSWSGDVLGIIFHGIGRSTVTLIAVVVCNAAYGLGVCEDIQNGEFWNIMSRVSKKKYVFSKIVSCMLGTTSCYFLGAMLSVFIMIFKYPLVLDNSMTVENLKEFNSFSCLLPQHTLLYIGLQFLLAGLCCSWVGCLAAAVSVYIRDSFVTLCLPLILYYLLFYIAFDGFRLPVNLENLYMMMVTGESCVLFMARSLAVTVLFGGGAALLLYQGIRRKCEYA